MKYEHEFHFGAKRTTIYEYAAIGLILDVCKGLCVKFLGVTEEQFIEAVDEANRNWFKNQKLNDYVLKNEAWLELRIARDVDSAIEDYKTLTGEPMEVTIEPPTFSEELEGETPLGGELRLTAPYKKDYEL
ncbi:hypothetical protein [Synechococcus phage S-N03]|uniref:Uncharacterized protein n=1 Tax=Synechococcus phage S-N03 TaxID=2718943 RepID=A0A6G8R5Z0_9CAUD|nr:hypothetical protein PQC09_gp240 [Synechococcus phage S-N03]QIN96827.1 hypothetical protein [Synechococcus phage S-N03]